jgi:hypothetical protein
VGVNTETIFTDYMLKHLVIGLNFFFFAELAFGKEIIGDRSSRPESG